jgi:hypothetical protein
VRYDGLTLRRNLSYLRNQNRIALVIKAAMLMLARRDHRFKFINRQPRLAPVNHSVAVGADESKMEAAKGVFESDAAFILKQIEASVRKKKTRKTVPVVIRDLTCAELLGEYSRTLFVAGAIHH